MKAFVQHHPLVAFFAFAYLFTWALQGALALTQTSIATPLGAIVNSIAIFGLFCAALLAATLLGKAALAQWQNGFRQWRVSVIRYAIALGLPLVLITGAFALQVAPGGNAPIFTRANWGFVLLTEFVRIALFGEPLGEEPGS